MAEEFNKEDLKVLLKTGGKLASGVAKAAGKKGWKFITEKAAELAASAKSGSERADNLKEKYDALRKAGFSEEEARELLRQKLEDELKAL